ncbi:hypothetical protein PHLCEN_2v11097 [Hermanssonia centrifuga]|uniref:DUF6533 domain-containing protein n=1 Tax=Hermanssonia centrifuga TaxID=98765 RepID=A0A2R6NKW5_9APHY|nr:hypothetical protein PHLCEN_2v11097 [Hermanssonia centrifuga]
MLPLTAILFFDYLLTLADEVRLFWVPRRPSFVVMFFFAARYGTILGHIPVVVGQVGLLGHDALYAVVIFLVDGFVAGGRDRNTYFHRFAASIGFL